MRQSQQIEKSQNNKEFLRDERAGLTAEIDWSAIDLLSPLACAHFCT